MVRLLKGTCRLLWHGELNVRQCTETWDIFKVTMKRPIQRWYYSVDAINASADGATNLTTYSANTDVLALAIRRYSDKCPNTTFVTGRGANHRSIKLQPIVEALGPAKTAALPTFHAITRADNTGSFLGKGKVTCWKKFLEADDSPLVILVERNSVLTTSKVELKGLSADCIYWRQTLQLSKISGGSSLERSKQSQTDCQQHELQCTKLYCVLIFSWWFGTTMLYQIPCCHHQGIMDGQWRTGSGFL